MEATFGRKKDITYPQLVKASASNEPRYGQVAHLSDYTRERFFIETDRFLNEIRYCTTVDEARHRLSELTLKLRIENSMQEGARWGRPVDRTRDCARTMLCVLSARSDEKTGFSVTKALWDTAQGRPRPDLGPGFFAEIIHLVWGIEARTKDMPLAGSMMIAKELSGREAAVARSAELDVLSGHLQQWMGRYVHGLDPASRERRAAIEIETKSPSRSTIFFPTQFF